MPIALKRVLRLAERQWGVVARWQLEQHGLSAAAISRWAASGRLHRIYPGVYAVGHRAICAEGRLLAAILYAGPGAALTHASAASWWRLIPYLPDTTHVLSPIRRRSLKGVRVHHIKHIERVMHRGLPVTPVARTLLDLATVAPLDRVRKAVAEADYLRLLDLHAIDAMTGVGRAGSARLKQALHLHRPEYARTLSPLEDLLLDLCRRHRIPFPEVNVHIRGYLVDALWREQRVVVEVDGKPAHGTNAPRGARLRPRPCPTDDGLLGQAVHLAPGDHEASRRGRRSSPGVGAWRTVRACGFAWGRAGSTRGCSPGNPMRGGASMAHEFKRGDRVQWNFRGKMVVGRVRKRLTSRTEVGGQVVAAANDDPRYLVRSEKSGAETARRPDTLKRLA